MQHGLQDAALGCNMLYWVARCSTGLQHAALGCNILHWERVALGCNVSGVNSTAYAESPGRRSQVAPEALPSPRRHRRPRLPGEQDAPITMPKIRILTPKIRILILKIRTQIAADDCLVRPKPPIPRVAQQQWQVHSSEAGKLNHNAEPVLSAGTAEPPPRSWPL
jgi:hypothetical protein